MVVWAMLVGWAIQEPSHPSQHFDAVFHLNAVQHVIQTGSATAFGGPGNAVDSLQSGNGNLSTVDQGGLDNKVNLTQPGNGNDSLIIQGGSLNVATVNQGTAGNGSIVSQVGTGNTANVTQGSM